jgi:hypothetical protein
VTSARLHATTPASMCDAPEDVAAWLATHCGYTGGPVAINRVGFGQSNITSVVTGTCGQQWVLREPPPGPHASTAHDVHREARIMRNLAESGIPVPHVVGTGTTPSGSRFFVMERVAGAAAPPYSETFDGDGESFAPHHYEQLMMVNGAVRVDDVLSAVTGHGLRDHSWGPRSWQAPFFYRWVHGSTRGLGFMGAYFGSADGADRWGGFVWDGDTLHICNDVAVSTERDSAQEPQALHVALTSGKRHWEFRGDVGTVVPLRHRRGNGGAASATRIAEAATMWTCASGTILHGMAEYLDQLKDGVPVGLRI